jgi:hypothetical protein
MPQHKRAGTLTAGVGLLLIAVLTLSPDLAAGTQKPSLCLICGSRGGEDAVLNVLLFIPFGFGLRLRGTSRWRAWAVTIAVTATVELLQIYIPGRDSTLGDVIMNSIGGITGILLCDSLRVLVFPSVRQASWLLWSGTAVWLALVALGGWAMRPWIPTGPYVAQLAPDLDHIELFKGRVIDARVDDEPIVPNAPLASSDALRDSLVRGTFTLRARIVPAAPTYDLAPIVSIASPKEQEVVVLGQDWSDAVFRVRLRSGALRMNIPDVTAARAFPAAEASRATAVTADTTELRGVIEGGRQLRVTSASRGTQQSAELALSPFLLWSLATPTERRTSRAFEIESIVWVAMLLAPLGYWAGRWKMQLMTLPHSRVARAVPEIVLVIASGVGLAAMPMIFAFPVANASLWIAAVIAVAGAFAFGARWRAISKDGRGSLASRCAPSQLMPSVRKRLPPR